MNDKLTPREAVEEIKAADLIYRDAHQGFHRAVLSILSRVSEEETERGHAARCQCCDKQRAKGEAALMNPYNCPTCKQEWVLHPYRDPRCSEAPQESVEEVARWLEEQLQYAGYKLSEMDLRFLARAVLARFGRRG